MTAYQSTNLSDRHSAAFTLIELLATIASIAVLLAILLPSLSSVFRSSSRINHLANLRELSSILELYSQRNRSRFPFMGIQGHPELGVEEYDDSDPGPGISYNAAFFAANSFYWPTVLERLGGGLQPTVYPDPDQLANLRDRFADPTILGSVYRLTHATVAVSDYWKPGPPPDPTSSIFAAQQTHQITFPSAKGILLALNQGIYDETLDEPVTWILVSLGDGSARRAENPVDSNLELRPFGALPFPILTTLDGLQGRDF